MHSMMLKMGTSALKTKLEERELDIDWDDYNYPPGLRIIHYKPTELVDKQKILIAKSMHVAFLVMSVFYVFNLIINVMGCLEQSDKYTFFMILYSLFHALIGIPIALGVFSRGYRALAGISDERTWYKYGEIFILVFTGFAFCFHMLCYHGLKLVINMKKELGLVAMIFGLIEQTLLFAQWALRLYGLLMVLFKYMPVADDEKK